MGVVNNYPRGPGKYFFLKKNAVFSNRGVVVNPPPSPNPAFLRKSYFRKYRRSAIRSNYGTCSRNSRTGGRGKRGGRGGQRAGGVNATRKRIPRKWRRRGNRRSGRVSNCRSSATRLVVGAAICKCKLPTPARVFQKATSRPPPSAS